MPPAREGSLTLAERSFAVSQRAFSRCNRVLFSSVFIILYYLNAFNFCVISFVEINKLQSLYSSKRQICEQNCGVERICQSAASRRSYSERLFSLEYNVGVCQVP